MFSATWPEEVRNLAEDFQRDPVFLNVGSLELSANHNIKQIVEVMYEQDKQERLPQLLGTLLKEVSRPLYRSVIFVFLERRQDSYFRRDQEQNRRFGSRNLEKRMERQVVLKSSINLPFFFSCFYSRRKESIAARYGIE